MFNYVPILKWKRGERVGARHLKEEVKDKCIPLLNIMRNSEPDTFAYQIQRDWGKNKPIYFDFHPTFIPDNDYSMTEYLEEFTKEIDEQKINPIPTITINKPEAFINFINKDHHYQRAVIRIYLSEFDNLTPHLNKIINILNIDVAQLDLIIDLEEINFPTGALNQLKQIINNKIKELEPYNFKSIIIAGASFPEILSGINYWSITTKPRKEFLLWEKLKKENSNIIFGDYICDDSKDPQMDHGVTIIPTIRYTFKENWFVIRGEHNKNRPRDFTQYHKLSNILINEDFYCNPDFSWSDNEINEIANTVCKSPEKCNHGNPEKWVQYATNHHITFTVSQLN